jgi:hypothetical protein
MSLRSMKHVVRISSNLIETCAHCGEVIGGDELFDASVNHYLSAHGYKLLHVGAETTTDRDDRPWHATVAILGANRLQPDLARRRQRPIGGNRRTPG